MADRYLAENNDILQLEDASGYYLIDKDAIRLSESSNIAASAATSTTQRLTGGTYTGVDELSVLLLWPPLAPPLLALPPPALPPPPPP